MNPTEHERIADLLGFDLVLRGLQCFVIQNGRERKAVRVDIDLWADAKERLRTQPKSA
jgi:hypothetical protein